MLSAVASAAAITAAAAVVVVIVFAYAFFSVAATYGGKSCLLCDGKGRTAGVSW